MAFFWAALSSHVVRSCREKQQHKNVVDYNCVAANAMSQTVASFVQSIGHLAAAMHLESKKTGEWPWSNRPPVENTLQPVKSPLPPVVTAIRQPHHDEWLFSGFYSLALHCFSFSVLELPCPWKTHFLSNSVVRYTKFSLKCSFPLKHITWPWWSEGASFSSSLFLSCPHLFSPITSYKWSKALTSASEGTAFRIITGTQCNDLKVRFIVHHTQKPLKVKNLKNINLEKTETCSSARY